MGRYRKRPVVIEARRFDTNNDDGSHLDALVKWIGDTGTHDGTRLYVETLEGVMTADVGDWIIRGVAGEFYPCKPDIFAATYEAVDV